MAFNLNRCKLLEIDSKFEKISYFFIVPILFIVVCFYLQYSLNAWFFQDDFGFLSTYKSQLYLEQIINIQGNFGRFFSRNLYWFGLQQLFGNNSTLYFLINFGIICASSILIYKLIIALLLSRGHAFTLAVLYFCSAPIIESYAWLSNSQHLLSHFFILSYLLVCKINIQSKFGDFLLLFLIFILGVYSNILMVFVIPLHFFLRVNSLREEKLLKLSSLRQEVPFIGYILTLVMISMVFILTLRNTGGAYTSIYTFEQLLVNLKFYSHSLYRADFSVLILVAYLGFTLYAVTKRNFIALFFLLASFIYFIPFAFLEHQKYLNYIALSFFFYWTGVLTLFNSRFLLILLFIIAVIPSISNMHYFSNNPRGADVKNLVEKINVTFESSDETHLCLTPYDSNVNSTGVEVLDIPPVWWFLGFGEANKIFNYKHIKVDLLSDATNKCNHIWIVNRNLNVVKKSNIIITKEMARK